MNDQHTKNQKQGSARAFQSRLAPVRRGWMLGTGYAVVLGWGALALTALIGYAVLDAVFAIPVPLRYVLGVVGLVGLLVFGLSRVLAIAKSGGAAGAAAEVDRMSGDPRRPVLTALELSGKTPDTEFGGFLREQAIAAGVGSLGFGTTVFPKSRVKKAVWLLAIPLAVVTITALFAPRLTGILAERIFRPGADSPPYSPLEFVVSPARHSVIYGDAFPVSVTVSGGDVKGPVELVMRDAGGSDEVVLQTFRKGENVFAQQLENVVGPGEFCFRTGRARSVWFPLEVLYEPRIRGASLTLTPPLYSGLAPDSYDAGSAPVEGLRGSTVRLVVSSNRPLASGTLALRPTDGLTEESVVLGTREDTHSVVFEWPLAVGAELEIAVTDLLGTGSPEPLLLSQELLPDAPPAVAITEPTGLIYATPSVSIPVEGYAEDDLALRRVELARALGGFRDRVRALPAIADSGSGRRVRFAETLDMASVGTEPGQVLELYLEATDHNPALTGVAASDPVRIEIISEEKYAAMVRQRTTISEFMARYEAIASELSALRETLASLASAPNDAATKDTAVAQLESTAGLLEKLAADFPAYDLEKSLAEMAERRSKELAESASALAAAPPGSAEFEQALARARERSGAAQKEAEGAKEQAEQVAAVAKLMEQAAAFRQIYEKESNLVRRLQRFSREYDASDLGRLGYYQQEQEKLRDGLVDVLEKIDTCAAALPPDFKEMADSAQAFAAEARGLRITDAMAEASAAAGQGDGLATYSRASAAKERMEQLLNDPQDSQCESFCAMCKGEQKFQVPSDLGSTLSQMLGGLFGRGGGGTQPGGMGGTGLGLAGGGTESGSFQGGSTPLNIPIFGPDRMSFGQPKSGRSGSASGAPSGSTPVVATTPDASGNFSPSHRERATTGNVGTENVPEKYRDAVRRYFLPDSETTTTPATP